MVASITSPPTNYIQLISVREVLGCAQDFALRLPLRLAPPRRLKLCSALVGLNRILVNALQVGAIQQMTHSGLFTN